MVEGEINMRVLVVDDSQVIRNLIIKELQNLNIVHIEQAVDGEEAIRKINARPYDLVTLDLIMPKVDGTAVLQHIKEKSPRTRVVVCSSVNEKKTVMSLIDKGIHDFVLKPFALERLKEVLSRNVAACNPLGKTD